MAESIKVAVRVRPLNSREKDKRCTSVVSMSDQTTTVQYGRNPKHFTYDFSYMSMDPESSVFATQEDVFRDIGQVILDNALDGFNGTLFAYGQTGSGKSYCMMGPNNDPGIIPRTVERLFRLKAEREDEERELQIWISYLEIYKEQVTDLLCAEKEASEQLKIMDHPKLGVYVRGLQEVPCAAKEEVMKTLTYGIKKRVVAATNMNARSSRSHAVFCIRVNSLEGPRPKPGQKDERKTLQAKVNLIDLAGSERQSKAGTTGENLREGCAINQSLSALGMVIKTLSEVADKRKDSKDDKGGAPPAAPFRMSKLTFLLKDSLAGNSKTYMMATISPANDNVDESLTTLRFASSVKNIKTVAVQNKDQKDELIEKMEEEIRALKAQARAGGLNPDDARELVVERTRLRDEMMKDFQGELTVAKEMQLARERALEENGLSQDHITQAFGISKGSPYLLNMADDPMLAGCLIYLLKDSEVTRIGAHKDNTITLKGVGIPDFLCCIENSENANVSIELISDAGRVVVNGRLLQLGQPRQLHNGDHIFLGRAYALKLIMAKDASGPCAEQDLSLEGLEDEYAALDDSPSWRSLAMYLDQVLRQMPANAASELFKEMKKACQFCDEANELTSECRNDEPIHFEVDLTSSVPACVVIRVLYCNEGRDCEDEEAWQTKYLWTVSHLMERIDRMRDYCEAYKRVGYCDVDAMEDPWHEVEYADLAQRLRTLELEREEARSTMFREKLKQMRSLLAIRPSDTRTNHAILQIFMRCWKMHVEETRQAAAGGYTGRARHKARNKVVVNSPTSTPRASSQKRTSSAPSSATAQRASNSSTTSDLATATSEPSVPPSLPAPPKSHERQSVKRRLTLKRSVHFPAEERDSVLSSGRKSKARPSVLLDHVDQLLLKVIDALSRRHGTARDLFYHLDVGHHNIVTEDEFDAGMKHIGLVLTAEELTNIYLRVDKDHNGEISIPELDASLRSVMMRAGRRVDTPIPTHERAESNVDDEMAEINNPFQLDGDEQQEGDERQLAPESTPEAASTSSNIERGKAEDLGVLMSQENKMLKMQLEGSQEEKLALQRQLDIAWQLCAVLRDYALQDRARQEHPEPEKDREPIASLPSSTETSSPPALRREVPSDAPSRPPPPTRHVAASPPMQSEARQVRVCGVNGIAQLPRQPASMPWAAESEAVRGRSAEKSPPRRHASPSPVGVHSAVMAYPVANTGGAMPTITPLNTRLLRQYVVPPAHAVACSGDSASSINYAASARLGAAAAASGHWPPSKPEPTRSASAGPQVVHLGSAPPRVTSQRQHSADAPRTAKGGLGTLLAAVAASMKEARAGAPLQALPIPASSRQSPSAIQQEPSPAKKPEAKDSASEGPDRARKQASGPGRMTLLEEQVRSLYKVVHSSGGSLDNGSNVSVANE